MKLGKLVDQPMTAAEAARLGGLDFTVSKCPLRYETSGSWKDIPERQAIVRTDTGQWLGIMSKDYPLLQYGEAFDFMDQVGPKYVAAGALKGGRQGFMVVRALGVTKVLSGVDPHDMFAVLRTSHDGSRAVEVSVMPLRQRCMNQLTLASFTAGVPDRWAIKHTSTMAAKLADAEASLGKIGAYTKSFEKNAQRLIEMKITAGQAEAVIRASLPDRPKREDQVKRIVDLLHTSPQVGFDHTGWGLVNAVSEYFDWERAGGSPESRFIGALQGQTRGAINRVTGRLLSRA